MDVHRVRNADVNVALKKNIKKGLIAPAMISTWNIHHLDLCNHRFSALGCLCTRRCYIL